MPAAEETVCLLLKRRCACLRAKEAAKAELAKLEQTIAEERKIRQKELAERRKLVQAKIEVNQRMEQRERKRRELQLEAAGEMNMDGEQNLIKNYVAQGFYSASAEHELQMQKDKVTTYEEAFRRIKEATGIEDINEVIEKFLTQDETAANLTQLTKEAQARIEKLNDEKLHAKAKAEEMRYAGPGTFGSRRIVDEYDAKLSEANAKCDKNKKRFDKMTKLLVNAKAGIEHLSDRLVQVKIPDGNKLDVTDETVLEVLLQCEQKLLRLVDAADDSHAHRDADQRDEEGGGMHLAPHNVRVALSDNEEESEEELEEDAEEDEAPLDRGHLKDAATSAVERAQRKSKARRSKRDGGGAHKKKE